MVKKDFKIKKIWSFIQNGIIIIKNTFFSKKILIYKNKKIMVEIKRFNENLDVPIDVPTHTELLTMIEEGKIRLIGHVDFNSVWMSQKKK
jgi:hypothetical protein